MSNNKPILSIIIVHYKADEEFFNAIESIKKLKTKLKFEIIVVDNDEEITIKKKLAQKFPDIKYIKSPGNIGFGSGNNLGNKHARGDFLFFLNPDTIVYPNAFESLVNFLEKNPQAGIVAPLLLDPDKNPYPLQGTTTLNLLSGAIALSFINKLFPNNPISKHYWQTGWDKTKQKEVDVVPGTAFVIRKKLYEKIGGFDENFFLYFEEFDLCKRIRDLGYRLYIIPTAKVLHLWGRSTKHTKNINKIFVNSRKYYFRKHYGLIGSLIVELFTSFNKEKLALLIILLTGLVIRSYKIKYLMPFIGDQGWFYISARNMMIDHTIPLVGITSSHPWLHQGAIWTYILGPMLVLFNWNPLAGAYLSIGIGMISIYMIYLLGKGMFSTRTGLTTAFLFATSPLVILNDRMPYHTASIPLCTILFIYFMYKWLKGSTKYLPLVFLCLAILYNLELATAVLWGVPIIILVWKFYKKQLTFQPKILLMSCIAIVLPMLPMIFYDTTHGFPQTAKFVAWIGYKLLRTFGFPDIHGTSEKFNLPQFLSFTAIQYQRLIYDGNILIAIALLLLAVGVLYSSVIVKLKQKMYDTNLLLIALIFTITTLGYFIEKTPSAAYFPMLFPQTIFVLALSLELIYRRFHKTIYISTLLIITSVNIYSLIQTNYYLKSGGYGFSLTERQEAAKKIIKLTNGQLYNLQGKGEGSQFQSFTMNYEYLTWYLGHPPSHTPQKIKIIISENNTIVIHKTHQ